MSDATDVTGWIRQLVSENGTVFCSKKSNVPSELADLHVQFWIKSERDRQTTTTTNNNRQTDEQ